MSDERQPYRDPLDAEEDVQTPQAAAITDAELERDRVKLLRDTTTAGHALLTAVDALVASALPDSMERAELLAKIVAALEDRRNTAIARCVLDEHLSVRDVAKRLGWTPARVAFATRPPAQRRM